MDEARAPSLALAVAVAVAVAGLVAAAASGGPYLTSDAVNGWVVVFAAGLLGALYATPFAIERRIRKEIAESDRRWERALLAWGAIAVVVLAAGVVTGLAGEWSGSSLAGTAGLLTSIEAALVIATMLFWLLSG